MSHHEESRAVRLGSRSRVRRVAALAVFSSGACALALAQEHWSAPATAITATLWGTAYGSNQFVAVGDRGTIVGSADGIIWTARPSGTDASLMAVTHTAGQFIAVGDSGTVLVSRDGAQWRRVTVYDSASGTRWAYAPSRLNAAAGLPEAGSGPEVHAAGEEGVAVWGAPIAERWAGLLDSASGWVRGIAFGFGREVRVGQEGVLLTPSGPFSGENPRMRAMPLSPRAGANLEAIVFAAERLVTVGQSGAILVSTNATTWTERPRPTAKHLYGLTHFNGEFVAVGQEGVIFRSDDSKQWQAAAAAAVPTAATLRAVAASDRVIVAVGDNGVVVRSEAAPKPVRVLESPDAAQVNVGGAAAFRVSATGSTPLAYQWLHDGAELAGATGATLVIGRVGAADAGSYQIRVTNATGAVTSAPALLTVTPAPVAPIVDPNFRARSDVTGQVSALLPQPDGRIVVATLDRAFDPTFVDDASRASVVRLLADGRTDPGFLSGTAALSEFEPRPDLNPPEVTQFVLQPDNRIIVAGRFARYNGRPHAGLLRLNADGSIDDAFVVASDVLDASPVWFAPAVALQPDGKILTLVASASRVVRLLPDGAVDPAFNSRATAGFPSALAVGPDGRVFLGTRGPSIGGGGATVIALLGDGRVDPEFTPFVTDSVQALYPLADGRLIVSTRFDRGPFRFPRTAESTYRLLRNGALDESFPIRAAVLGAAPAPDGRLLIGDKLIASDGVTESSPSLGFGFSPGLIKAFAGTRQLWVGGSFDFYHGVPTSRVAKLNLDAVENLAAPKILAAWPERPVFRIGETVTLRAAAIGDGPLTYTWTRGAGVPVETAEPVFRFPASSSAEGGDFVVSVRNSAGSATSLRASFAVEPDELRIAWQPRKVSLMEGRAATLWVQLARASEARRTEWRKDGQPTDNFFPDVTAAHAGNYTVTFTDVLGNTITSDSIEVTVGDVSRIVNLSTRAQIGAGGPGAILGFVIPPGISPREVLIRGIGPGLVQFGVGGALVRPRLDVFDAHGRALARTNDATDFGVEDAAARAGAFPIAPRDGDTAVVLTLRSGSYTAQLSGIEGAEGLGLIELYETDRLSDRLVNVSSRVLVRDGEAGAAIAGVAIRGAVPKRVLVRVAGPALTAFGVDGVLVDPRLEVRNEAGGIVATNDDWQEFDGRAGAVELNEIAQLPGVMASVGAFAFPSGSKDAARLVTLEPGNYSVVALGNGAGGGIALVEIYEVPQ